MLSGYDIISKSNACLSVISLCWGILEWKVVM